jgi:hypothetical protein
MLEREQSKGDATVVAQAGPIIYEIRVLPGGFTEVRRVYAWLQPAEHVCNVNYVQGAPREIATRIREAKSSPRFIEAL